MKRILLTAAAATVVTTGANAESFFQASLTPDIAIQPRDERINGISLNIWGENPQSAFSLGFVNGSTGDSKGFSYAIFGLNYSENYTGVQMGIANYSSGSYVGWQSGLVNIAKGEMTGLQSGFVNYANDFGAGVQLGFVNWANTMEKGVQIGLANIVAENAWFTDFPKKLAKGFVFVNWSFE